jgi:Mlc titration factor MtfA (ptsG expression regulator)
LLNKLRHFLAPRAADVSPQLWEAQLHRFPALRCLGEPARRRLRTLCGQFLGQKTMTGAAGFTLTAEMELHIAAQACLPILNLGLAWYRGWRGIVVYPAQFRVQRRVQEDNGLEREFDETLAGEAWDGGPVVLSWQDSAPGGERPDGDAPLHLAGNVVIHEFAHTLDLLDGNADGIPPLDRRLHAGLNRGNWARVLEDAYERFCAEVELTDSELPADIDPDSAAADRHYARLPLDPYAATDLAEFFAVSSEALFVQADGLQAAFPAWHDQLCRFYRLDPVTGIPFD